jgi:hypothetical protein
LKRKRLTSPDSLAAPPTGSLSFPSTLYTSLKCSIVSVSPDMIVAAMPMYINGRDVFVPERSLVAVATQQ